MPVNGRRECVQNRKGFWEVKQLSAAGIVILTSIIVCLLLTAPALAAEEGGRLYVQGQGSISVKADIVYINLGVLTQAKTAGQAQEENARRMQQILAALQELGISPDNLKTSHFNIQPVQRYDKEKGNQIIGYRVTNTINITLEDLDKVGKVIDRSIAAGATNVNSIRFSVVNRESWKDEALAAAVNNARHKAEVLAHAAGVRLGPVLSLRDANVRFEPYDGGYFQAAKLADRGLQVEVPTPIHPGQVEIRASVEMVFALE